jgi:SAM-dependent methyltransferase
VSEVAFSVKSMSTLVRAAETLATYNRGAGELVARLDAASFDRYLSPFVRHLPRAGTVLDLGCGGGRDLRWLVDHGFGAIGLDASSGMLAAAHERVPEAQLIQAVLPEVPVSDSSVDGVWSCAALLHLAPEELAETMRRVARVLRPGGILFVSTAAGVASEWRPSPYGRRWFHYYQEEGLAEVVSAAGLVVTASATEPGVTRGSWVNLYAHKPS